MTRQAYGQAYQTGFDRTVRFLISRGAVGDGAAEAAQAAWARGWERLDQLRDERVLLTWINTIALNVFRSLCRKEKLSVPLRETHSEFRFDATPIDLDLVLRNCRPRERALLELQVQGVTAEEIAWRNGTSKTAIRIRLMRARRAVYERLERKRLRRKTCSDVSARGFEAPAAAA